MDDRRDRRGRLISRGLLALALALGALGLALIGQAPNSNGAGTAGVELAPARAKLKFSRHAEQRLRQRAVTREAVERLVGSGQSFSYRHAGVVKQGYYDARTGLFVATQGGVVLTVIARAEPGYVERLKRGKRP